MLAMRETLADYTERRLREWGQWSSRSKEPVQQCKTNIATIINCGGVFIKSQGLRLIPENKEAEELDRCIVLLNKVHPREGFTLTEYYTTFIKKHELAEKLKVDRKTINDRLIKAKFWVECELARKLD